MNKTAALIFIMCFILRGNILVAQKVTEIVPLIHESTLDKAGWELIFADEFDAPQLNASNWWTQEGIHGSELQYYTSRSENVFIKNSFLHLRAIEEKYKDSLPYTSGMVVSSVEFGKGNLIEVRCKIPKGKGLWPAFWFWSGWNKEYQELDVFEFWCHDTKGFSVTNHWNKISGAPIQSETYWIRPRTNDRKRIDMSSVFMTYGVYWDEKNILFLLNNQLVAKIKNNIPPKTFPIILNLAVDNDSKKRPNKKTIFPADFLIDYVRVYKRLNLPSETLKR